QNASADPTAAWLGAGGIARAAGGTAFGGLGGVGCRRLIRRRFICRELLLFLSVVHRLDSLRGHARGGLHLIVVGVRYVDLLLLKYILGDVRHQFIAQLYAVGPFFVGLI